VKLLRAIRLDASDSFVFDKAAEPGEWAVSGPLRLRTAIRPSCRAERAVPSVRAPHYTLLLDPRPQNLVAGLPIRQVEAVN
jgi:hypothetical protein